MSLTLGEEIATYLASAGIGLTYNPDTTGSTIFVSQMPDQPDLAACVYERGGVGPLSWMTGPATGAGAHSVTESKIDQSGFQIMVRAAMGDYDAGSDLVADIYGTLQGLNELYLNGTPNSYFHEICASQSPQYLMRDDRERHLWTQNWIGTWEFPR